MIDTDDLLLIYRHSKALVMAVEKVLREQGVIKCQACGEAHKIGEPHTAKPTQPIVLTRKMIVKPSVTQFP